MAGPWYSQLKKKDNPRWQNGLEDKDPNPNSLESYFEEKGKSIKEHLMIFESYDKRHGTDFSVCVYYIYKQFELLDSICIDTFIHPENARKNRLGAAAAGARIFNEIATLDLKLCSYGEKELEDRYRFREATVTFFNMASDCLDKGELKGLLDYPKTIDEFYAKYNLD